MVATTSIPKQLLQGLLWCFSGHIWWPHVKTIHPAQAYFLKEFLNRPSMYHFMLNEPDVTSGVHSCATSLGTFLWKMWSNLTWSWLLGGQKSHRLMWQRCCFWLPGHPYNCMTLPVQTHCYAFFYLSLHSTTYHRSSIRVIYTIYSPTVDHTHYTINQSEWLSVCIYFISVQYMWVHFTY